ncbi:MAG: ferrichrome ABC transporter permease [Myxococcota bacterium]
MTTPTPPRSLAVLIFAATIGVGACLLFQVQFILGKQILPWFGGAPAVWTTCMLFFQVLLLVGYGYAHLLSSRLAPRRQRDVHLAVLALATGLLLLRMTAWPSPINPSDAWKPTSDATPSLAILILLLFTIGLPYLVLSSTGPLLQAWYARCFPGVSPYRLYALSNLGSLLGLLSYPFVLEPLWPVATQGWGWSVGFLVFALGCAAAAVLVGRTAASPSAAGAADETASSPDPATSPDTDTSVDAPPTRAAMALWLVLAMIASVLLLAVTSQISLEVAVIPFLWMLPLALYLLSFVLCFEYEGSYRRTVWIPALLVCAGGTAVVIRLGVHAPMLVQLATYLLMLLCACMVCHGELVRRKPAPRYLTGFYLLVSAGGAAGGVFTGIVAPALFPDLWELPLALVAACALALVLGLGGPTLRRRARFRLAVGLGVLYVLVLAGELVRHAHEQLADNLHVTRGFFGVLRVDQDIDDNEDVRTRLRHGRIIHGLQYEDPDLAREPSTYYGPGSGVGLAIGTHPRRTLGGGLRLGFVGLGAGTLACYALEGDTVRFYEINPDVVALSSGPEPWFTYLRDARGTVEVAVGDARVNLEREPEQGFDVLALDAFSSDAIPAHLLTEEAIRLYLGHLRDADSVIAVHISNRYLDLDPVVRGLAEALDLAVIRIDDPQDDGRVYRSDWMLLATDEAAFARITEVATPVEAPPRGEGWPRWTDAYSNLVQVLKH